MLSVKPVSTGNEAIEMNLFPILALEFFKKGCSERSATLFRFAFAIFAKSRSSIIIETSKFLNLGSLKFKF